MLLHCAPELQRFEPAIMALPEQERTAVRVVEYVPLMRSGRYWPGDRKIEIGEWSTDRDLWHEWGHALFVGNRAGFPPAGKTTAYGLTNPDEDVAECYAELVAGTNGCSEDKLDWIRAQRAQNQPKAPETRG